MCPFPFGRGSLFALPSRRQVWRGGAINQVLTKFFRRHGDNLQADQRCLQTPRFVPRWMFYFSGQFLPIGFDCKLLSIIVPIQLRPTGSLSIRFAQLGVYRFEDDCRQFGHLPTATVMWKN